MTNDRIRVLTIPNMSLVAEELHALRGDETDDEASFAKPHRNYIPDNRRLPVYGAKILIGPVHLAAAIDDLNLFLVSKAFGLAHLAKTHSRSLEKLASNLCRFANWLDRYWMPSLRGRTHLTLECIQKNDRVTYAYLKHVTSERLIQPATQNQRIADVRAFYMFLRDTGALNANSEINFQASSRASIRFITKTGFSLRKTIEISDLKVRYANHPDLPTIAGQVSDGGRVRPLSPEELKFIVPILHAVNNPALRIGSFLSLNSGARLQTVLTFRKSTIAHIKEALDRGASDTLILVGGNELVQTKRRSAYQLRVPTSPNAMIVPYADASGEQRSIAEILVGYANSDFYRDRIDRVRYLRGRHNAALVHPDDEYLFIGRNGMPYYLHAGDPLCGMRASTRCGGAIKLSMAETLGKSVIAHARDRGLADLALSGVNFHDFRGTFAEHALLTLINVAVGNGFDRIRAEEIALKRVQRLLGHSSIEVTRRYLNFRANQELLTHANETFIKGLLEL